MSIKGYTLLELIIVVVVIMTLAMIAIPSYSKSKKKAMGKEAISNLKLMNAAERIYQVETGSYANCADASTCNSTLKLYLNATNWAYSASGGTLTAVSQASTGMSCTYSLSAGSDGEPTASAGCV